MIQPSSAQANIRLDIFCNHHAICYCGMIDYANTMKAPTTPQGASCSACIGPPRMSEAAKGLASLINEFGIGDERAVVMLKALHTVSTMQRPRPDS